MRQWTRTALIALIALVAVGGALSLSETTESTQSEKNHSWSDGVCETAGVTLVIDFGSSSDLPALVRCAEDFDSSGWELFEATGVSVAGTSQYPVGFVCRVEDFPLPEIQNCLDTPKYSEGSWGYYTLDPSGTWKVSGVGSSTSKPGCGLAEGWRFIEPGENIGDFEPRIIIRPRSCN